MAEEIITLISKEYATGNFQSKLTEANEGDNIKITGEGDNLKISAEIPAHAKTTITTSDERVVVTETQTGYDLGLNGSFVEEGEYRVLENTVGGHTTSITNLEQSVAGKQDTLSAGTGINLNNNTISVDTATSVGTSNLPVTASAVNTKLGDYATTSQLNNKQDNVGFYVGDDGNVTTNSGGITQLGSMYENLFDSPTRFGDVEINDQKPVLDVASSDGSITVTRSADGYGVDLKANGGGSDRVTTDSYGRTLILGRSSRESSGALVIGTDGEFVGELGAPMIYASGSVPLFIGGVDNFISFYFSVGGNTMSIRIGTEELELNQAKLQKLKQLLES